jgi:hypothetical protein
VLKTSRDEASLGIDHGLKDRRTRGGESGSEPIDQPGGLGFIDATCGSFGDKDGRRASALRDGCDRPAKVARRVKEALNERKIPRLSRCLPKVIRHGRVDAERRAGQDDAQSLGGLVWGYVVDGKTPDRPCGRRDPVEPASVV